MALRDLALALVCVSLGSCHAPYGSEGEKLARTYCAACHAFPEPALLDKETWRSGVLPQMAARLGIRTESSFNEALRNPYMTVLTRAVSVDNWGKIVRYYLEQSPDTLPYQTLPAQPQLDPAFFKTGPLVPRMQSSGIITLLTTDPIHERIFVGEAGSNRLLMLDWHRQLLSTVTLGSPATGLIVEKQRVLVLESGILEPNDQPKGSLVQYDFVGDDSLQFGSVVIDSLFRPVFVDQFDFDGAGEGTIIEVKRQ